MSEMSSDKTTKSTQEKEKLFLSLVDMFVDVVEPDIIQMILQNRSYDLNSAVEDIMILSNNLPTKKNDNLRKANTIKDLSNPTNATSPCSEKKVPNTRNSITGMDQANKRFTTKPKNQSPHFKVPENRKPDSQSFLERYNDIKGHSSAYERTLMLIREGVKLMVILRGPPGIGKSFLAKRILNETVTDMPNYKRHIFSSDDFFITNNIYYFVPELLSEAHSWNQRNVSKAIKEQVSPIIVDNTNTQAWEMRVYADMAVSAGYDVEIVEPDRLGTIKESELAKRNVHGVPKAKIRNMMDRYEKNITPNFLLQQFNIRYLPTNMPPQPTRTSKWKDKLSNHKNNKPKKKTDDGLESSRASSKFTNNVPNANESLQFQNRNVIPNLSLPPPNFQRESDPNDHYLYFNGISKQSHDSPSHSNMNQANVGNHSAKHNPEDSRSEIFSANKLLSEKDLNGCFDFDGFLTNPIKKHDFKVNLRSGDSQDFTQLLESSTSKSGNEFSAKHFDWMAETNKLLSAIGGSISGSREARPETLRKQFTEEMSNSFENTNVYHDVSATIPSDKSNEAVLKYESCEPQTSNLEEPLTAVADPAKQPCRKQRSIFRGFEKDDTSKDYVLITDENTYMYQRTLFEPLPNRDFPRSAKSGENNIEGDKLIETLLPTATEEEKRCNLESETLSKVDYDSKENKSNGVKGVDVFDLPRTFSDTDAITLNSEETEPDETEQRVDRECKVPSEDSNPVRSMTEVEEVVGDIWSSLVNNVEKLSMSNSPSNYFAKSFKDLNEISASEEWNTDQKHPLRENQESETSSPKPPRNLIRQRVNANNSPHKPENKEVPECFSTWNTVSDPLQDWCSEEETGIKQPRLAESADILPQRIKHSKTLSESSTNTNYLDFSLANQLNPTGVKVLVGNPKSITDFVSTFKAEMPETLFLDKSTMTGEETSDNDETTDISQISLLFPHIPKKCILEMVDKCQGNMDWAVDLLLDSEHSVYTGICEESEEEESSSGEEEDIPKSNENSTVPLAEPTMCNSQEHDELKKMIESSVVFDKSHYSDQVLKVIQRKRPEYLSIIDKNQPEASKSQSEPVRKENESLISWESEGESDDLSSSESECDTDNEKEFMELIFSNDLLLQLKQKFGNSSLPHSSNVTPVVKMPVSLARQLYGYIMDSIQSEMDHQQDTIEQTIMKDEEIAKLLQYDEEQCLEPQLQEIMDMEIALAMHKADQQEIHDKSENTVAARLSQNILFEKFPLVDRKVLVDMLKAHNYSLHDTLASLALALDQPPQPGPSSQPQQQTYTVPSISEDIEVDETSEPNDLLEEAQSHRDQAATYYSLRSECLSKAHEAFRSGNKTVATYYSQMAQLHKRKVEVCNSRAAACLLTTHKQGNTLDLHFLHVMEAEVVLDMFIDEIISELAQQTRNHRTVFIITGRGLRSRGGISRIKPMTLRKLQARKLQYTEVNPGMLSVLIQSSSALSHNN